VTRDAPLEERGLPRGRPFDPELETTPRDVQAALESGVAPPIVIDCRRPDEHERCALQAPSERLIPMHETAARLDELSPYRDREIVVYCHTGRRSLWVARYLREHGFTKAKSMAGGIDLWSRDIDPTIPRY